MHLTVIVQKLRTHGTDLADVEVKAAAGGLPKGVKETVSAFANGHGGTIILGLDEELGFTPSAGFKAKQIMNSLASACADDVEPPVRAQLDIVDFDGAAVVVAEIPEVDPRFKPCYVKARGEYGGSFIRGGDGDRRLTDYEIHLLHTNRGQPRDDVAPATGASVSDLNGDELAFFLRRLRQRHRRAFAGLTEASALQRVNVLTPGENGDLVPTLAGLLTFGDYPQQFYPQLNVTFVAYPGFTSGDVPVSGPRFLDNRAFDGPIPYLVEDALDAVTRNMAIRAYVDGSGREDVFDYPPEAVREALVNALVHRDYSSYSHGAPVQITMYADRLVIANPGGLYGAVTEDDLGQEGVTSSRNPALIKILQDARLPDSDRMVCENRGSGIPAMLRDLRRAHAAPPEFRNRISRFTVTFHKATAPKAAAASTSAPGGEVTVNVSLLEHMQIGEELGRQEIQDRSGRSQVAVVRQLNELIRVGMVEATAPPRSPHRRYRRLR